MIKQGGGGREIRKSFAQQYYTKANHKNAPKPHLAQTTPLEQKLLIKLGVKRSKSYLMLNNRASAKLRRKMILEGGGRPHPSDFGKSPFKDIDTVYVKLRKAIFFQSIWETVCG